MGQSVAAGASFPCTTTGWLGGFYTSTVDVVQFSFDNVPAGQQPSVDVSFACVVNGQKQYQTVTVPPAGTQVTPVPGTEYIEISLLKGANCPPAFFKVHVIVNS